MRQRILHVITDLEAGGAETMLVKVLEQMRSHADILVISLMSGGALVERVQALGIPLVMLGLPQGGLPTPGSLLRLIQTSRTFRPTVVQGWMYHGNLVAWLIAVLMGRQVRLFWNIRQTLYNLAFEKRLTRLVIRLCQYLSRRPAKILYNSETSARQHEAIGYPRSLTEIIPNGFDLTVFRQDTGAGAAARQALGIPDGVPVVLHVSRYHPMKDQKTLLEAARLVLATHPAAHFVLVGRGLTPGNPDLAAALTTAALTERVHLIGPRQDIPQILTAGDMLVSSSAWGEAFPNVIGEAMASGLPCVVTDVGESGTILGPCGIIVPPGDPSALAEGILALLQKTPEERAALGAAARHRVQENFEIGQVSRQYMALYDAPSP